MNYFNLFLKQKQLTNIQNKINKKHGKTKLLTKQKITGRAKKNNISSHNNNNKINNNKWKINHKYNDLLGISISLKGRVTKSDRSRSISYYNGKIKKNSAKFYNKSSMHPLFTKKGVVMLKVSLLHNQ